MQLVIDTAQTKVTVRNDCFYISSKATKRQISPKRVSSISITSNVLVSAAATMLAAENQVPIHYYNRTGDIMAAMRSPYFKNLASLRRKQVLLFKRHFATQLTVKGLTHKFNLQKKLLFRLDHAVGNNGLTTSFASKADSTCEKLRMMIENEVSIEDARSEIMGLEGSLSRRYWKGVSHFLPPDFQFERRTRRPAKDGFNAALNYLYGMTYAKVENAVFAVGLDPMCGFFHTENYRKTSLVFDLIEPFRPFIDELLINMFRFGKLESGDFEKDGKGLKLGKKGKKKIIPAYYDYVQERFSFNEQVRSLSDHIHSYANQLIQDIKNQS